jgi:flagellar P-ring protein precursor FlgI
MTKVDGFERILIIAFFTIFYIFISTNLFADKIKNISSIIGVRDNQLIGYGLVVGLNGSGDTSSKFTNQTLSNLLKNVNVKLDPKDIKSKNVAAVMVTATLPPFAREGDKIDVTISSIGDASSLEGGVLLITPLKGVNGKIYALAQGPVSIGGFNLKGGNKQKHFTTTVKIPNGATVERAVVWDIYHQNYATLSLKRSDFDLAVQIQDTLNKRFNQKVAVALDPRTVKLKKPNNLSMPEFLAEVQNTEINTKIPDVIVIDERTGTIVAGSDVTVKPTVITYGGFVIKIKKESTILDLTEMFQKFKATPQDVIAILENLKASSAINAKLIIN